MLEYAAQRFMGWKLRHKNSSVEVIAFFKSWSLVEGWNHREE